MNMKSRFTTILAVLFLLTAGSASAQLYIGPSVSGGLVYGQNFIVSDTSQYHLPSAPGVAVAGGVDILYAFDENIRAHVGIAYRYKQLNLAAPDGREGLSFSEINRTATAVSIPMSIHYRIPLSGGSKYFNVIAGHSLDFTNEDSTVVRTSSFNADSIQSFTRHEYQNLKRIMPTILLGAGLDFETGNGSILNVTAMWNLGTGRIFRGNISEWEVINSDFDAETQDVPEEFPEHYFDFALRGSSVSLQVSYWFNLGDIFSGKDDRDESMIEDEE